MATIHRLAGRGDPFELLAALEAGADPDDASGEDDRTPLMYAAKHDHRIAARLLLKFGANVNAVDAKGQTALLDAAWLEMKRLLLDAGADPDLGRIEGMTLMAFFASFGDREMVEFLRSYGADTGERMRKGPTVQEALDDPDFAWNPLQRPETPESRKHHAEFILQESDGLRISPEQYVTDHREILIWGLHTYEYYDDPRLGEWATRVSELIGSLTLLETAYRQTLQGDALEEALRSLERPKWREERECLKRARDAEFEAMYFHGQPKE